MRAANINLSPQELQLVTNTEWILTKNKITQKVYTIMGLLQQQLAEKIVQPSAIIPAACKVPSAKIAKGEKYKELPYIMLDYPRYFTRENIFAFRSFFWWGHYFSCTMHIAGSYKEYFYPAINRSFSRFTANDWFISTGKEAWIHDLQEDYIPVNHLSASSFRHILSETGFIKISKKFPLEMWGNFIPEAVETYKLLEKCLQ